MYSFKLPTERLNNNNRHKFDFLNGAVVPFD